MRSSNLPWRIAGVLSVLSTSFFHFVEAGPSVNVGVKASFSSAPYLIELLETAALENSSSYFPLLDRIAAGSFADLDTDKSLYDRFVGILQEDGHTRDPESLSAFKFALAVRAAAPRIETHFQYYNTSVAPFMMAAQDAVCPVWVHFDGKQFCSPALERAQQDVALDDADSDLPFDRVLGSDSDVPASVLYADITHPMFGQFHETISKTAREGRTSYRLRYRPSSEDAQRPLFVNGYGVELVLKRTDYIVIDDREETEAEKVQQEATDDTPQDEPADLKPLTMSEVSDLGLNAASYILTNEDPFATLLKVSANFPSYSSSIALHNASHEFLVEHGSNRATLLPTGFNVMWINGLQIDSRHINAFSLLDHLQRERKLIGQMRQIGFSAAESISLLSHEVIAESQGQAEPQRYDWRDNDEGGSVIMWLNDIEKDKRYQEWPRELGTVLQRMYPGQLPSVRRDMHNLVVPVDLANPRDLEMIIEVLLNFVKRTVPIRIGLVPTLNSPAAVQQAKLGHHVLHAYGLSSLMLFLQGSLQSANPGTSGKSNLLSAIAERPVRPGREAMAYHEVLQAESLTQRLDHTRQYLNRLALNGKTQPFMINGVTLPRSDSWLDALTMRVTHDLRSIQKGVLEGVLSDDVAWVPQFFLEQASPRRNAMVIPEDLKNVKVVDVSDFLGRHRTTFERLPRLIGGEVELLSDRMHLLVIADLDSEAGQTLLSEAIYARRVRPETDLLILHNPAASSPNPGFSEGLYHALSENGPTLSEEDILRLLGGGRDFDLSEELVVAATLFGQAVRPLAEDLGFEPGQQGMWLNGRVLGPVEGVFEAPDFETLFVFEKSQRIIPVTTAITSLGLEDRFTSSLDLAMVTSLVARAHKSDIPEGIYESAPLLRIDKFNAWQSSHTMIYLSNSDDPTIKIVASIDPASEVVQPWIPILKTLSELHGTEVKIYLNPRSRLSELPVKRYYRQVIDSAPSFDVDGRVANPQASFSDIPQEALLNLGMVIPPAWLVAPEDCIYDLDNIKLSSLPTGQNIDATYELEHILIEGHSRDVTTGRPPRGAQILLGTEQSPHFTDTIIMANLGYFQFKANPGFWHISLEPGRSSKIYKIDSVGAKGYAPQPNDETTSVALLSFQGATLYPRLSRKPGMEEEDVLETNPKLASAMNFFNKGASLASSALSSVGLTKSSSSNSADINIFSVASGHLYERMLNIMMLSVMKHTTHTVKFWFIEQFLSPSFKSFLPHLAAHYKFDYEMITYKWPHWLRGQKEKQREIWGYKILFLDVLFPISLEKVIFVDADQIVRTDMMTLNNVDLQGAPYGFTPMCDSRTEMEGFRFWKQGYWKTYLQGKPYHISALYVVDLKKFRELAAGDRLRQQYQALSSDPASLSNLDQDLPNHMQHNLPIHSLPQEWLWCETWCSDESLGQARTIDLCNNPLTKEPKLDRARRQVPEWTVYDEEIAEVAKSLKKKGAEAVAEADAVDDDGKAWTKDEL